MSGDLIVTPDYTVDIAQVYSDFAGNWLDWTHDLNILSFVAGTRTMSLASWVPIWDEFDDSVIAQRGERFFSAGLKVKTAPQLLNDGKHLKVQGVIFDSISYHSTTLEVKDFWWGNANQNSEKRGRRRETVSKWVILLSHTLHPASTCIYPDGRRLVALIATLMAELSSRSLKELEPGAAAFLLPYLSNIKSQFDHSSFLELEERADPAAAQQFEVELAAPMINRCFIVTENGHYGLAPSTAREGDYCCIILGARAPFIVRPITDLPGHYELVGEAYTHRMMEGEIVKMCDDGEFQEQDIILV